MFSNKLKLLNFYTSLFILIFFLLKTTLINCHKNLSTTLQVTDNNNYITKTFVICAVFFKTKNYSFLYTTFKFQQQSKSSGTR